MPAQGAVYKAGRSAADEAERRVCASVVCLCGRGVCQDPLPRDAARGLLVQDADSAGVGADGAGDRGARGVPGLPVCGDGDHRQRQLREHAGRGHRVGRRARGLARGRRRGGGRGT